MPRALRFLALSLVLATAGARAAECSATDDAGRIKMIARWSFNVHVRQDKEYEPNQSIAGIVYQGPAFANVAEFETFLVGIARGGKAETRHLNNDETAYWDAATGTVLKINPHSSNCGIAHRPAKGYANFMTLR